MALAAFIAVALLAWRPAQADNNKTVWTDAYGAADRRNGSGLALCTVVHGQQADLREFLEYHLHLGVDRIYLYDHASEVSSGHSRTVLVAALGP